MGDDERTIQQHVPNSTSVALSDEDRAELAKLRLAARSPGWPQDLAFGEAIALHFKRLGAQRENEACAKVCGDKSGHYAYEFKRAHAQAAEECAAAIRARKDRP